MQNGQGRDIAISIRGLKVAFGDFVVHDGIDLDIHRGETIGIVGASGTGKSVLMHAIIGLLRPQAGSITVFGEDILTATSSQMRRIEQRWGVLFQDGALFTALTVAQNVQVPLREQLHDIPKVLMDELAAMKISMVGLAPESGPKYPSELSGGMRKRAGIARAISLDPDILFLDEPTAGLDPISATAFDELVNRLQRDLDLTVVMVTHDLDTLNATCDRIAVLADKRVRLVGTMEEMLESNHPWIHEYFHGPRSRAAGINEEERP